jgi:hypothetical protein
MAVAHFAFVRRESTTDGLISSTIAVLIAMTCAYDAAVLGRPWAMGERFAFAIVWPVALPIYIIRSRGWWGCALLLIHAAALSLVACAIGTAAVLSQGVGR